MSDQMVNRVVKGLTTPSSASIRGPLTKANFRFDTASQRYPAARELC